MASQGSQQGWLPGTLIILLRGYRVTGHHHFIHTNWFNYPLLQLEHHPAHNILCVWEGWAKWIMWRQYCKPYLLLHCGWLFFGQVLIYQDRSSCTTEYISADRFAQNKILNTIKHSCLIVLGTGTLNLDCPFFPSIPFFICKYFENRPLKYVLSDVIRLDWNSTANERGRCN